MCRHCCRNFAPSAESIAFFGGFSFCCNGSTILNLATLVFFTVNSICKIVPVDFKCTNYINIFIYITNKVFSINYIIGYI